MAVSVVISDPQFLTRAGISSLLDKEDDLDVTAVESVNALERRLDDHVPNVIIMDYMSNGTGISKVEYIINSCPSAGLLVISADSDTDRIRKVINSGVKGYLTKSCEPDEILMAVRMVSKGNRFFCNQVMEILVHLEGNDPRDCDPMNLSSREFEVLKLIAQGFTTLKIADKLNISIHTVNSHRKNILKKLNIKSPTQLVAYAHETGLVKSKKF